MLRWGWWRARAMGPLAKRCTDNTSIERSDAKCLTERVDTVKFYIQMSECRNSTGALRLAARVVCLRFHCILWHRMEVITAVSARLSTHISCMCTARNLCSSLASSGPRTIVLAKLHGMRDLYRCGSNKIAAALFLALWALSVIF